MAKINSPQRSAISYQPPFRRSINPSFRFRISSLVIFSIVIMGCAGQIPPSGGPVDKTPPEIVYSSPSRKQLNFNSRKIILTFDKYMSEIDVDNAIYFPPYTSKDMSLDWSGKDLTITLIKTLEKDRTYILTVGAGAIDLRGNRLAGAVNLVFSTGAVVDTGAVSGRVFSNMAQLPQTQSSTFTVAAFPITADIDTLNPSKNLAKYVTQSDDSGRYIMQGLAKRKYRLVCFDDQMKNFTYVPQTDAYSSATHDIEITDSIQEVRNMNFVPSIEDTSLPQLYGVELAKAEDSISGNASILVKFSKAIDSASLSPSRFVIRDSISNQIYPVKYAVRLEENEYDVILGTQKPLPLRRKYFVTVSDSVTDLHSNHMSPQNNPLGVEVDSATAGVVPFYFNFPDSLENVTKYDTLFCQFILNSSYEDSTAPEISLVDSTGKKVAGGFERGPATIFRVLPAKLNSVSWYSIRIKLPWDSSDSTHKDSIVVRHFKMVDYSTLGDIEGNISPTYSGKELVVAAVRKDGKKFISAADDSGRFRLAGILAGDYMLSAYAAHDSTLQYFSGDSYPYQFAKPFGVYPEEVKVRERWTTEGVRIRLH